MTPPAPFGFRLGDRTLPDVVGPMTPGPVRTPPALAADGVGPGVL
ncbi:hypothetical protein AB0J51_27215 [Micromonospora echinofusca]